MVNDVIGDARERILQTFPERQIYLRSGGEVSYYNLSTRLQLIVVSAIGVMALWCVLTIINLVFGINPIRPASEEVKRVEAKYERMLADSQAKQKKSQDLLAEQRASFETMAANLEAKHQTLTRIVGTDVLPSAATETAVQYADAQIVMAPTVRDTAERVARRRAIATTDIATGLPIDNSLTSLDDTQNAILISAEAELLDRIDLNRALIEQADMDIDSVLKEGTGGKGGLFIPIDGGVDVPTGEFQPRVTAIQARLLENEALEEALASMPLGHPVERETVMTSDFGVRSDPFNGRPTFHAGLDFIGGSMSPIVATAPGVVRFVGRNGGYGRSVEIDHGHGFTTRYAHLKKTFVKRGQKVEKGERIGGMGSTGRSTATHLHYEVHFQGRAFDPQKFLEAGQHVQ